MFELITVALDKKDIEPLVNFPDQFVTDFEKELITWIATYWAKHEVLPSVNRLGEEHPSFVPIRPHDNRPLSDVFEQTLKRKQLQFLTSTCNDLLTQADDGILDISGVNNLAQTINTTGGQIMSYSGFDRELYFRMGNRLPLNMPILDKNTGGMAKGDYFIIAGKLGSYKTTFMQWITYKWLFEGYRILFISNEMMPAQIFGRFDGLIGKFNPLMFRKPEGHPELPHRVNVVKHMVQEAEGDILVPTRRLMSPDEVFASAKFLNVDVVVIDGIYLMRPNGHRGGGDIWQSVTQVSNDLKQGALELGLPVLGVTQLKRGAGKHGVDYDVDDVGYAYAQAQDADVCMALRIDQEQPHHFKASLIKNRFGDQVETMLRVNFDEMTITDLSKGTEHGVL